MSEQTAAAMVGTAAAQRRPFRVSSAQTDDVQGYSDTRDAPVPLPRRYVAYDAIAIAADVDTRVSNGFLSHRLSPLHVLTTWTSSTTVAARWV
jgi:hypothetical protein